jgi:hypothetical protein
MSDSIHDVNAYVLGQRNDVYSIKVEIFDLGIYIQGMTMRKSKMQDGWWLQPPKHPKNGKYFADVEFDTRTELWRAMLQAATYAVGEYTRPYDSL